MGTISKTTEDIYREHYYRLKENKRPGELEPSWAIIELQGSLNTYTDTTFDGKFIGDLHFAKNGTPLFIIGHHLLYGKEMVLEKPFALMEKVQEGVTEYKIKAIVKRKIIFKTRPKPIVSSETHS